MVKEIKLVDKKININDGTFKVDELYKGLKKKVESIGWFIAEKEQSQKSSKYGNEIKFSFIAGKEFDYFGKVEAEIELNFENLKKAKGYDFGDLAFTMKATQKLDYKNRWGKNPFSKFLFEIYLRLKKEEFKNKYTVPIIVTTNEIYSYVKNQLEEYGD